TQYADELSRYMSEAGCVDRIDVAGSIRRARETVGDVDILVASDDPAAVVDRFVSYPAAEAILARGGTRASIRLRSGLNVDLRVLEKKCYGAALHYFTGSKAHSIAIRKLGLKKGLKINEYGVHRGARWIAGHDEAEVFKAVGLPWIPPELREDRGEIEAAHERNLPSLVTLDDVRGDLQSHTTSSDGRDTLEAMADAAEALGYEYLAVTDHTPSVRIAGGLDAQGFRRQWKRIDRLNARLKKLTLLKGVEVDIALNGSLDLKDSTLAGFDVVLASIHSHFNLSREEQTSRMLRAIAHPGVHMIAHPTARIIGRRQSLSLDLEAIFRAAADENVILEVNAQPERLDLDDMAIRRAIEMGVILSIDTDAHSVAELRFMRWGVDQARRGWAERRNILNTRSLTQLLKLLKKRSQ
ncbi:MAG TPA: PHP domain-containing protein, partial [Gemmatimonadaceae bacterium]|nr:PHP domain-containing protein [Gemmatimonadaceae bacterium]